MYKLFYLDIVGKTFKSTTDIEEYLRNIGCVIDINMRGLATYSFTNSDKLYNSLGIVIDLDRRYDFIKYNYTHKMYILVSDYMKRYCKITDICI